MEACSLSLKGSKWTSLVFHYRPFHPSFKDPQAPAPEDFLRSIIITVSYSLAGMTVIRTERIP